MLQPTRCTDFTERQLGVRFLVQWSTVETVPRVVGQTILSVHLGNATHGHEVKKTKCRYQCFHRSADLAAVLNRCFSPGRLVFGPSGHGSWPSQLNCTRLPQSACSGLQLGLLPTTKSCLNQIGVFANTMFAQFPIAEVLLAEQSHVASPPWVMGLFILVMLITYAGVAYEGLHKTVAALLGGGLLVLLSVYMGLFEYGEIYHILAKDLNVFGVIIGTGILVDVTGGSGLFHFLSMLIVRATGGRATLLFLAISGLTFVLWPC